MDYLKEGLENAIINEINNNQDDGFDLPEFLTKYRIVLMYLILSTVIYCCCFFVLFV